MNLPEQMDFINKIEADFPVDSWMIDGIHVWPLIRISLGMHLSYAEVGQPVVNGQGEEHKRLKQLKRLLKGNASYLKAYVSDSSNNARINQKVDAVFLGDQVSRIYFNESWYDRFCDPFISEFQVIGMKCLHIEPLHNYLIPRYAPGVFLQPKLDSLTIKSMLHRNELYHLKFNLQNFELFQVMLETNNIDFHLSTNQLVITTHRLRLYADFFKKILQRVGPQIGFVVSYYGLEGMAFNLACYEMGIPSVDIQHGVQGDLHCAYGRWNKVPDSGYSLLPKLFWVWSESEAESINKWNEQLRQWHQPFIGGNPWLNLWWDDDNSLCVYYNNQINSIRDFKESSIKILLTLQPGVPNHGIPEWIVDAIKRFPSNWFWLIRLHPCMLEERKNVKRLFKECLNRNFNIDEATNLPLPAILRNVHVHITHSSSTVIEAQLFGVPSIAFSDMGGELYSEHYETGWLKIAFHEETLFKMIKYQYERRSIMVNNNLQYNSTADNIKKLLDYIK